MMWKPAYSDTFSGASASTISILSTNGGPSDPRLHFSPLLDSNSPFCQKFFAFLNKIIIFGFLVKFFIMFYSVIPVVD